ncbi:MAG: thiamine ABC transporter substrate-binding protein, partial [Actinobacteria bacterium]|nr:thiamine ABC transporter substrate-binding protein [Actinomycetota bacterium]
SGGASGGSRTVRLVTYDGYALPKDAAAAFTKETGARIEVVANGDAGTMLTRALLAAGAPEGDVLFGVDNTLATRAATGGLLEAFTPKGIGSVEQSARLPGAMGKVLTPIDRGDVCINVDASWFAAHATPPPTSLEQLTQPAYRDLLVVPSPVTSSPGLAFLIGTIQAHGDRWPDYWKALKDNGVRVRPSWDDAYNTDYTVSGGDRPLVVSYASSPPAEVLGSEGKRTEPVSTIMADSCVSQVEYAGVLAGAEHPDIARRLVEFMLTPTWQEALPLSNYVLPIVAGTALPPEFQKWAVVPATPRAIDPVEIGRNRDRWIEQWRSIME